MTKDEDDDEDDEDEDNDTTFDKRYLFPIDSQQKKTFRALHFKLVGI